MGGSSPMMAVMGYGPLQTDGDSYRQQQQSFMQSQQHHQQQQAAAAAFARGARMPPGMAPGQQAATGTGSMQGGGQQSGQSYWEARVRCLLSFMLLTDSRTCVCACSNTALPVAPCLEAADAAAA